MRLGEVARNHRVVTVELIPDRIAQRDLLELRGRVDAVTVPALRNGSHDPSYPKLFNVSPQQRSIASALIVKRTGIEPVASVTCRDCQQADLPRIEMALEQGLQNLLVLYGDPYPNPSKNRYEYSSSDKLIRRITDATNGGELSVGAVTNQFALDRDSEVSRTLAKVDAGADFVLTNISFDIDQVLAHRDALLSAGLGVPLLIQASIAHSFRNLLFVSETFGIPVPNLVKRRLERGQPGEGIRLAAEAFETLRNEADGVHFSYLLRRRSPIPAYLGVLDQIAGHKSHYVMAGQNTVLAQQELTD